MKNSILSKFKDFMFKYYPSYQLISSEKTTLSFKRDIPSQTPSCGVVGCLLILGVIPGIIYYLMFNKPAKTYTLNITVNKNDFKLSGDSPEVYAILNKFKKYLI